MFIFFDFLNNENVDNFVLILNFKYLFFDKKKFMVLLKCCLKEKCVMINYMENVSKFMMLSFLNVFGMVKGMLVV